MDHAGARSANELLWMSWRGNVLERFKALQRSATRVEESGQVTKKWQGRWLSLRRHNDARPLQPRSSSLGPCVCDKAGRAGVQLLMYHAMP